MAELLSQCSFPNTHTHILRNATRNRLFFHCLALCIRFASSFAAGALHCFPTKYLHFVGNSTLFFLGSHRMRWNNIFFLFLSFFWWNRFFILRMSVYSFVQLISTNLLKLKQTFSNPHVFMTLAQSVLFLIVFFSSSSSSFSPSFSLRKCCD